MAGALLHRDLGEQPGRPSGLLRAVLRWFSASCPRAELPTPEQAMPTAFIAPAGSEPGHNEIPAARLHAERDGVAVGTAVTVRQNEKENDGGRDEAKHEEADKNNGKDD